MKRVDGVPTAFPADEVAASDNLLQVVYDHGPVQVRCYRGLMPDVAVFDSWYLGTVMTPLYVTKQQSRSMPILT